MYSDLPPANILIVDDHPENLLVLEELLKKPGQNLVKASSGAEALRCLLNQDFAVILLDVQMPGMDGFETANMIRQRERSRNTPIIFVTAFSTNDAFVFKGYSLGAVDYLLKPVDPVILTSKVAVFVDLFKKTAAVEQQAAQLANINAELRTSEERFRGLSVCSPIGIFRLDVNGYCIYTNPCCREICGLSEEEGLGDYWFQFLYPDDRAQAAADWEESIHRQKPLSGEYRCQSMNGAIRWTHIRSAPMFSDRGELIGHVGTVTDMTDRKEAEAMREQVFREQTARQQAETINRMKDEFLAVVSHELRTPLNSILGWSKLLLTQKIDAATTKRALETIERNARSQAKLIEDILDISRIVQGKMRLTMQPVNLHDLLTAILETTRPLAAAKQVQLKFTLDPKVQMAVGDPERLQQILWNVVSNAIKFTPAAGLVEVKLSLVNDQSFTSDRKHITHDNGSTAQNDYAEIAITDTGVGISPEFLPYVFDRFRQADSTTTRFYGGLGLGLAIAHHLVQLHKGTIIATSEGKDKGATFTIHLPLAKTLTSMKRSVE